MNYNNIQIKFEFNGYYAKTSFTSTFNWSIRDFILKNMYMNEVWKILGCQDVASNIRKILAVFTQNHNQIGHIVMIILQQMKKNHPDIKIPMRLYQRDNISVYNILNESVYKYATNNCLHITSTDHCRPVSNVQSEEYAILVWIDSLPKIQKLFYMFNKNMVFSAGAMLDTILNDIGISEHDRHIK